MRIDSLNMIERKRPIKRKTLKVYSFAKFSPSALLAFFIGCAQIYKENWKRRALTAKQHFFQESSENP